MGRELYPFYIKTGSENATKEGHVTNYEPWMWAVGRVGSVGSVGSVAG